MKRQFNWSAMILVAFVVFIFSCSENNDVSPDDTASGAPKGNTAPTGATGRGISPETKTGNFVADDDDDVCFKLVELGFIEEETSDMKGLKIDPPASFANGNVAITLSADGKMLDWTSTTQVVAFIVKGGSNYNVFDYVGTDFTWDNALFAPATMVKNKLQYPQISHYNVCYVNVGAEGCTPGYWRNHGDRWAGISPDADFDATFGVDFFSPDITLGAAIKILGGEVNALARHATAALLNSYGGVPNADGISVDYPYTTAEVIQMVQDAVANGTISETKDLFEAANEAGCPLSGTSAVRL
jgi:hypothetical protein